MDDLDLVVELKMIEKKNQKLYLLNHQYYHVNDHWFRFELTFVNQYNFDDCIQRYVDFMCAHTISAAISWPIITVTELLRIYFIILG